ncbi:MAG: NADH-quinone oxidoreductase subunit H [Candidatus Firestonebacteria bacterium]
MKMLLQVILIIIIAPLTSGLIKKLKNNVRMRKGAPILQPYYNLVKLFKKNEVISKDTSYIFKIAPYIVLTVSIAAVFLTPSFFPGLRFFGAGDVFVIVFIFALGRFFLALAGLDAGSAFGGMGSSREMFISALSEPALFIALFAASMNAGGSSVTSLIAGGSIFKISLLCAGLAFYFVMLAETSRVPVDNQETHLELTMIHEAMILEYSGKSLALIELGGYIKQLILLSLLVNVFIPGSGWDLYIVKVFIILVITALLEVSMAKMRLFRAVDFLIFSFILSFAAVIAVVLGA